MECGSGAEFQKTPLPLVMCALDCSVITQIIFPVIGWVGSGEQEENHARRATQKMMMLKRY